MEPGNGSRRRGVQPDMKTLRFAVPTLVAALALGACAPGDAATDPTPTPSGGTVTTPAEPTPSEPTPVTPSPADPTLGIPPGPGKKSPRPDRSVTPGVLTLTGTVSSGVEPGCLLLDSYLLLGGPGDVLKPGARVTVTGQAQPDLITTCQQGTPFVVESAKRS